MSGRLDHGCTGFGGVYRYFRQQGITDAAVLDALGIMQGVGGGSFAPGKALTRAQFCKLAVTAMGVTDVSPYASYTIFRMLSIRTGQRRISTRQVRHPELKGKGHYPRLCGRQLRPDKIVSYGEVCDHAAAYAGL